MGFLLEPRTEPNNILCTKIQTLQNIPESQTHKNGYRHPRNMQIKTKKWDLAIEIRKKNTICNGDQGEYVFIK